MCRRRIADGLRVKVEQPCLLVDLQIELRVKAIERAHDALHLGLLLRSQLRLALQLLQTADQLICDDCIIVDSRHLALKGLTG